MNPRRPLPDSEKMDDRRVNERLLRWSMVAMGFILVALVVLGVLVFVLQT